MAPAARICTGASGFDCRKRAAQASRPPRAKASGGRAAAGRTARARVGSDQRHAFKIAAGALQIHVRRRHPPAESCAFRRRASSSAWRNGLVLCDSSFQPSTTVNFCSASFAESAERSAPTIIFLRQRVIVACAAPAHAPCRPGARAANGSSRYARGPCPSASRACGPSR